MPVEPCSVLVTEDDPAIRKLLAVALRRSKITLTTAADGQQALELLALQEWLVLVLDLMMPGVTGWEVIEWLGDHPERKPNTVIVVTATERSLLHQLDATVVNAVIFKPFDIMQLAAYVKASCDLGHEDRRRSRLVNGGLTERRGGPLRSRDRPDRSASGGRSRTRPR